MSTLRHWYKRERLDRAISAFMRRQGPHGEEMPYPSAGDSTVEKYKGDEYVVLRNRHGTLAVYRIRGDGRLQGLSEWPAKFDNA